MSKASELRAWAVASAAAFCLFAIGYRVWNAPEIPDLAPSVAKLNATLDNVNGATGAWASASAQQVRSVTAIERDLRAQLWHVDRLLNTAQGTLQAGSGALGTLNGQLAHLAPLLDSLRASSDAIPPAVAHLTETVDGVRPVLAEATGAVKDVRWFIRQPALSAAINDGAGIVGNGRKISDKVTADFLKPVPWYMKPIKRGGELIDIVAAAARHVP